MIRQITDTTEKRWIARTVLESLRQWFEIDENREKYIKDSADWLFFAAYEDENPVGFLCLKETGSATVEIAVMGVMPQFHRHHYGTQLFLSAKEEAESLGYRFMQVKTVKEGIYEDYDRTNAFYKALGFEQFEVIPEIWGADNPCQIYVMSLAHTDSALN
ncbi:MAG: GNAT family N-acetyltransferase [Oscillospiraceae bacterium]|nr:GNAT family N-acetyltransferase [Oscillospiraceae bacterium]